jgi:hypothetical protein
MRAPDTPRSPPPAPAPFLPSSPACSVIVQFARLRVQVVASTEERVALDAMARAGRLTDRPTTAPTQSTGDAREVAPDLEALDSSLRRLKSLLESVAGYVDDVVGGRREGDEALGRSIADALASVPSLDVERLRTGSSGGLDAAVKDVLMVTYLSNLAAVHLKIAERVAQLPTF